MIIIIDSILQSQLFRVLRVAQFVIALLVFTLFALMPSRYVQEIPSSAPTLHFVGNLLIFASAWVAWRHRCRLGLLLIILIPYSILVELAQGLTPSRQVDPLDLIANFCGLFVGIIVAWGLERWWRQSNKRPAH